MVDKQSYFQKRIFTEIGASEEDIKIELIQVFENTERKNDFEIFKEDKDGNIQILVYTLDRRLIIYDNKKATPLKPNINNNREQIFYITRYKNPHTITNKEGEPEIKKYNIPKGIGTFPFFPPKLVEKFENKEKIKTLILTEGYFKAFKGSLHGLDIVGLSSITHYKQKDTKKMYNDVIRIIINCEVENIIILYDGDCRAVSNNAIEKGKDLYTRPFSFVSSAQSIRDLLNDYEKNIYFAHVKTDEIQDNPKGLDDLFITANGKLFKADEISNDLLSISTPGNYFHKINITTSPKRLLNYFNLTNVNSFYTFHADFIENREFIFRGTKYQYDEENGECNVIIPKAAKQYFRVGDSYYEFILIPNKYKQLEKTFHRRLKSTIIDDHGAKTIKHIPKYKAFCNVPDHTNYIQVMDNCFNVYGEFEHEPDIEETCPTILFFIKHIFGKHYRLGMDYIQLLYQKPTHILPILCLVSKENNTGKSTFIKLLKAIFTSNCTVIGNDELSNSFNASWANKLCIVCEESLIEKQPIIEKIKALSTADKIMMNAKGKDMVEIDFFGKFILVSNNEDSFIFASKNDVRYWVIKVPKPKKDNPDLLNDMIVEIPAFLAYLNKRKISTKRESRMWFKPEIIKTEALAKLIETSRPKIEKEITNNIHELFMDFEDNEILMTTKLINKEFFNNKQENTNIIRILRDRMEIEQYTTATGQQIVKQFTFPRWQNAPGDKFIRVDEKFIGRPWVFKREDFINNPNKNNEAMTYEDEIYTYLDKMEIGSTVSIDKVCKPENKDKFIFIVKEYIDNHEYGNGIEFSNDFTKIKKNAIE